MHNTCISTSKVKVTLKGHSQDDIFFFNKFIVAFADKALIIILNWKPWDDEIHTSIFWNSTLLCFKLNFPEAGDVGHSVTNSCLFGNAYLLLNCFQFLAILWIWSGCRNLQCLNVTDLFFDIGAYHFMMPLCRCRRWKPSSTSVI
jgi:hypothetical protein